MHLRYWNNAIYVLSAKFSKFTGIISKTAPVISFRPTSGKWRPELYLASHVEQLVLLVGHFWDTQDRHSIPCSVRLPHGQSLLDEHHLHTNGNSWPTSAKSEEAASEWYWNKLNPILRTPREFVVLTLISLVILDPTKFNRKQVTFWLRVKEEDKQHNGAHWWNMLLGHYSTSRVICHHSAPVEPFDWQDIGESVISII